MPISTETLKKYKSTYFIETGSHVGNGIQSAIDVGFDNIISIELSEKYHDISKQRFINNKKVSVILGDAELVLDEIIRDITEPITFWLDGHDSGDDTAVGLHPDPIYEELEIIKNHNIKTHTLLIDDIRGMDIILLKQKVLEINDKYQISFEDGYIPNDILVAKIVH